MAQFDVVEQFAERAKRSQTKAELFQLLEEVTAEIGFRYFALIHHADLRRESPAIIRIENYPASWATHFVENGLYALDPIHCACLTSHLGFTWAQVPGMIAITSRQRAILESAAKHGLGEGYTVPVNIPGESSGSCSFATRPGQRLAEENLMSAQLIGAFAFQAARRLTSDCLLPQRTKLRLTPRQHDCLIWAIKGKTDWEISRILGLSQETVSRHLDMARGHCGASTRLSLAVRAIFDGQVSFIEALSCQFPPKRK